LSFCVTVLYQTNNYVFDCQLMHAFYDDTKLNDPAIREAWYIYCFYLLPLVNYEWHNGLTQKFIKFKCNLCTLISISDEALVHWFLILELTKTETKNNQGKTSKSYIHIYKQEYHKIHIAKQASSHDTNAWNDLFWTECEMRHPEKFIQTTRVRKPQVRNALFIELPLPGFDANNNVFDATEMAYY
jgi:hypothetical protein